MLRVAGCNNSGEQFMFLLPSLYIPTGTGSSLLKPQVARADPGLAKGADAQAAPPEGCNYRPTAFALATTYLPVAFDPMALSSYTDLAPVRQTRSGREFSPYWPLPTGPPIKPATGHNFLLMDALLDEQPLLESDDGTILQEDVDPPGCSIGNPMPTDGRAVTSHMTSSSAAEQLLEQGGSCTSQVDGKADRRRAARAERRYKARERRGHVPYKSNVLALRKQVVADGDRVYGSLNRQDLGGAEGGWKGSRVELGERRVYELDELLGMGFKLVQWDGL
jgi:hypothetical protein